MPFFSYKQPVLRNRKEPLSKFKKTPATTVKSSNSPFNIASQTFVARSKLKARKPVKITGKIIKTTTVPKTIPVKTTVKQTTIKPTASSLTTTTVKQTTAKTTTTIVPTTTLKQTTAKTTTTVPTTTTTIVPTTTVKQTTAKTATTTRRPTTKETRVETKIKNPMANSVEEDEVLDFSSGSPKVVK